MAKPQIKKVKKDSKGVTYYFSDDDGIMCVDIDVEPGVKSVVFQERQCASKWKDCYSRFLLRNVKKQFPDVERLIIEWRVKPRPIRLHINKTYAVCCPSDVSAGLIFSSYTCQSSRTYVYDILFAEIPHIL